ncbi:cell envelope biogenesis protein OmpA [Agrobacterium vitis]|uniref:cell envelope biogenesis protein OmpA n=1 Tax=Rhizobium/Agrobacterium group TaxID=227290 RepID=UPI0008DC09DE|nr:MULTISPECIES: cell envelope biogenesis protein OmpA [Rhizobium/Agrobacterium group]MCF1433503.1 cell envelope biogenesis protein OmpA [Allorhizobium ampelinum]MUO90736.1 cell envelope biogenesis protein OmpA [Agrobacterium vitis]MUZ54098.1 cell envelope biogenesis protein OmpA [Agrobacterium vitis]MUZ92772.1 cell envelope biogenesis protein OmpA [Agrobacterium vitis]MVA40531.1 cell envelope biogenesis protein OmpA [Agrobacterium vitis]
MFETAFTFGLTQFARSLSLPERLQKRPLRNAALEPWRLRNSSLDALYYDIRALTSDEAFYISDALAAEGLIMIVPPTGQGMLTLCETVDEYLLRGGREVRAMAVAGIGGSAAGAAAFARNVADAIKAPVCAVVSGYGLGDVVAEALGGAFFFGPLGFLRRNFEMIDDLVGRPQFGAYQRRPKPSQPPRRTSLDADTVQALLCHPDLRFNLVTGHSKGNLIVAEALNAIEKEAPERLTILAERLQIITFSTRVGLPAPFSPPLAIIGELDWYGELNATAKVTNIVRVARAGHSTNTSLPGALKITDLLAQTLSASPANVSDTASTAALVENAIPPLLALVVPPVVPEANAPQASAMNDNDRNDDERVIVEEPVSLEPELEPSVEPIDAVAADNTHDAIPPQSADAPLSEPVTPEDNTDTAQMLAPDDLVPEAPVQTISEPVAVANTPAPVKQASNQPGNTRKRNRSRKR